MNPSASAMWELFSRGVEASQTAAIVAEYFKIPLQQASRDCLAFENALEQHLGHCSARVQHPLPARTAPTAPTLPVGCTLQLAGRQISLACTEQTWARLSPALGHLQSAPSAHALACWLWEDAQGFRMSTAEYLFFEGVAPEELVAAVVRALGRLAGSQSRWLMLLHAGAAQWKDCTLLFPAPGGSGKSTLTAALMRRGWHFLGDDVVAVDKGSQSLWPLPLPISLKMGSWQPLTDAFPDIPNIAVDKALGAPVKWLPPLRPTYPGWEQGHSVTALVIPRYQSGIPTELRSCSAEQGLQALFSGSSFICEDDEDSIRQALLWAYQRPCYELLYSDLQEAASALEALAAALSASG